MILFYVVYIFCFAALFFWCWNKYKDIFHPSIIFIPQFFFLYGVFPIPALTADPERFFAYAGEEDLYWYHFLTVLLPLCLLIGVAKGGTGAPCRAIPPPQEILNRGPIRNIAAILGAAAVGSWIYGIYNVGGFYAAYGQAYGGGWDDSGYVRELPFLSLLAVTMVFLSRIGRGVRPTDWALILFCISPVLLHGLLGARRGPTFMALVSLGGGYLLFFMRKRVSLTTILPLGIMMGMLILFLVANRSDIHLGSEVTEFRSPLAFLEQWNASEYLIGSAVVRYTEINGSFFGAREATHLFGRMMPKILWPTVYTDLGAMLGFDFDITRNSGIDPVEIAKITGWQPAVGSAIGMVADLWIEYYIFAIVAAYAIGYLYGRVWRASFSNLTAKVAYLILIAISIYLVMQDQDAWLFRVLLLGIPLVLLMRFVKVAPPFLHRGLTPLTPHP